MKKYFFLTTAIASISFFIACGGDNNEKSSGSKDSSSATAATSGGAPAYKKLLGAITSDRYDCLTCHKLTEASTGPAYQDVANKYENTEANVTMLAEKIMKGGSGNWGSVPMVPHPTIPEDSAKQLVRDILAMRK
jgi:cytochrome c